MATGQFRIHKMDENEQIATGKMQLTKNITKEIMKRTALGDVGNRVLRNANDVALKNKENEKDTKASIGSFKDVKPKVDTYWRKNVAGGVKPVTRSDSLKATKVTSNKVVSTTTTTQQAKLKEKAAPKPKVVVVKREESHLSRRSLSKIRATKKTGSSSSISSTASSHPSVSSSNEDLSVDRAETVECIQVQKISAAATAFECHSSKMIDNIDSNDYENPLLVSEYVNDIYKYLNRLETAFPINDNYLHKHKEISSKMRTILMDWINEVHLQFKLEIETYYMAVSLIDRYLQVAADTSKKQLQLVGVTALFTASKYEELYPPEIQDFVYITDDTYNKKQILKMEMQLVRALDFQLGKPLPIHFLRRFSKASRSEDRNHTIAKYLIELASIDYTLVHYKPSEIAAAALFISLTLLPSTSSSSKTTTTQSNTMTDIWTPTLVHYTTYTFEHIKPIVNKLATIAKNAPNQKLQAVYSKYSSSKFECVAKLEQLYGMQMDILLMKTTTI